MTTTNTRKEEIQIAAAKLFGEKGFAASSVRDIAKSVGMGAASLYNHMGSKDELLTSICFRCANNFLVGMAKIESANTDPVEKIKELIRLQIQIALYDESSLTVFNDEWRHLREPFLSSFLELRRTYETAYLRIIKEGIEQKKLLANDSFIIYQTILSALRWLHRPHGKKLRMSEDKMIEQISSLLIKGIIA